MVATGNNIGPYPCEDRRQLGFALAMRNESPRDFAQRLKHAAGVLWEMLVAGLHHNTDE